MPKELPAENGERSTEAKPRSKRSLEDEEENPEFLSKNKLKKKARNPHKNFDLAQKRKVLDMEQPVKSQGHGLLFKTKSEKSLKWKNAENEGMMNGDKAGGHIQTDSITAQLNGTESGNVV
ncbi:UNVERIFIED_CONTAM: hypothetical protein FKN15_019026 [Acipenser sinensis]